MKKIERYLRDEDGAGVAEFVFILIPISMFLFGFMHMCMMMFTITKLHWAAEDAARCASIRVECRATGATVPDPTLVANWASARYSAYAASTFVYTASGCGHTVVGTANYQISAPFYSHTFALRSDACFPNAT